MKKKTLLILFIVCIFNMQAQNLVSGKVINENSEVLIGVNISAKEIPGLGASTNFSGDYQISLPDGCNNLLFQYIGYEDVLKNVCFEQNNTLTLNVTLKKTSELLGTVVISAGKFEQRLEEVTVSMDVIKASLIENKSTTSLDRTMNQSPSVHVVDGQANIRSGSGWSYGAGSRVMVMVDGIPLMRGDQGAVAWQLVPMENISQIEVIKGASSVLFGSSALNGTINIRTNYPSSEPANKLSITHTAYGKPKRESIHWYKGGYTSANNISYLHTHKKDNTDFVLGTNLYYDGGYQYKVISKRARINMSHTTYSKEIEGLSYGIKANIMRSKIADALMWQHDTLAYNALNDDPSYSDNNHFNIDHFITYNNPRNGIKHRINSRYFRINIYPAYVDSGQFSNRQAKRFSNVYYTDYQFQKQIKNIVTLTSGYTYKYSDGQDLVIYGNRNNVNHSLYAQADIKYQRLNLSFGGRFEHYNDEGNIINKPIFRSGINYQIAKATFLRSSYGEGIRFPSIIERYVNYATGPVMIFPNEELKPETGWSAELGIKQALKVGEWKGFVDFAVFMMQYDDMMEFSFGKWGNDDDGQIFGFGFKSVNIGRTQIKGFELSLAGEGKIGQTKIEVLGGYTYTKPYIDDKHFVYDQYTTNSGINPVSYLTTSSDTSGTLKYRYKHLAKFDLNIERDRIATGISLRYNSRMENIDRAFIDPLFDMILGTTNAWERLNKNSMILDYRIGYNLTEEAQISFNIDNIFNKEQSLRPASLSAPRTYSILFKQNF